jgi:DNA-binding NarL/FixJ family response regulator
MAKNKGKYIYMMVKVALVSTDRVFSEKIKKIYPDNLSLLCENQNKINEALDGSSNVILMDYNYIHNLRNVLPKAKVIIASNKYDLKKEYLSVRLGAKGFITKDIEKKSLKKVIDVVNSGQVWMTRAVTTVVFKRYCRMLKNE